MEPRTKANGRAGRAIAAGLSGPRAERGALAQSVARLAPLLSASHDGVAVLDPGGALVWSSPALCRMAGLSAEQLFGQPAAALGAAAGDAGAITNAVAGPPSERALAVELRRPHAPALPVSLRVAPLASDSGARLGSVLYLRELGERRTAEPELARRAEELQGWVHAVSHDLRSPLVAVLGFTRLLQEDYGDRIDDQGQRFLRRIEEAGRTMESLVQALLEFARIGRSEPRRVHVDPREVLLQLHAELKPRLEEAGVELRLPEEPPMIWCDRTQLYQVLSNLVGNALDHGEAGRDALIEVDVRADEGCRHLVVRDQGRGIDPADHERIFEIFHTRGLHPNGKRGTGIGLAIVRKIAESHGGGAWVESRPGDGASFHVTFPDA